VPTPGDFREEQAKTTATQATTIIARPEIAAIVYLADAARMPASGTSRRSWHSGRSRCGCKQECGNIRAGGYRRL
jgi:hypothetical protein